jgi:hypothetical protein
VSAADEIRFAVDLAKKNSEALSFIPTPRIEEYQQHGQLLIATENDDPCGFLIFGAGWPTLKIYQTCVQYDARRRAAGLEMVERLKRIARAEGRDISLWCAQDLEANAFWEAAGFSLVATRVGGARRGRTHNGWVFRTAPNLFAEAA